MQANAASTDRHSSAQLGSQPLARVPISFRTKLVVLGTTLSVAPLLVAGPLIVRETEAHMQRATRELQIAIASDVVRTIEVELTNAQDDLDGVGRTLVSPELSEKQALSLAIRFVESSETLDHAAVYSEHGSLIDTIRERDVDVVMDQNLSGQTMRRSAKLGSVLGQVRQKNGMRVPLVVPFRIDDRIRGYVASWLRLSPIQQRVVELAGAHLESADEVSDHIFVIDESFRVLAHADPEQVGSTYAKRGILRNIGRSHISGGALPPLSAEYRWQGRKMVGTLISLQGRPWAAVVQIPRRVAYGSVRTVKTYIYSTIGIAVLLAMIAAFVFARRIARPIRILSAYAKELAERKFDKRVTVNTRDELSLLGDAMSAAAEELEHSEQAMQQEIAIRNDLGRYLPGDLVDKVVRREQDMALGGNRREITILFADVVSFTPLTAKLSAEQVVSLLNDLFTILTEIVFRHRGTVDKFIGDCVMALWGAPQTDPNHASSALSAAEEMMRWLEAGNERWLDQHGVTIQLAIGVHSGEAIVGNVGSETRMEYTAIGDTVNVAARLESIARPGQILTTRDTYELAGSQFEFADIGNRTLSGRASPIYLFELRV